MRAFRKPGWRQWLTLLAFLFSIGVSLLYGARSYQKACYWREHRDEPLRAWMSVGYVAHSYRVPPPELFGALGLSAHPPDRRPIGVIARSQNRSTESVITDLEAAIKKIRASKAPPGERATKP